MAICKHINTIEDVVLVLILITLLIGGATLFLQSHLGHPLLTWASFAALLMDLVVLFFIPYLASTGPPGAIVIGCLFWGMIAIPQPLYAVAVGLNSPKIAYIFTAAILALMVYLLIDNGCDEIEWEGVCAECWWRLANRYMDETWQEICEECWR
jgi:hypothetical protein